MNLVWRVVWVKVQKWFEVWFQRRFKPILFLWHWNPDLCCFGLVCRLVWLMWSHLNSYRKGSLCVLVRPTKEIYLQPLTVIHRDIHILQYNTYYFCTKYWLKHLYIIYIKIYVWSSEHLLFREQNLVSWTNIHIDNSFFISNDIELMNRAQKLFQLEV